MIASLFGSGDHLPLKENETKTKVLDRQEGLPK